MYMSREAIRRAVVQRFNEAYNWEEKDFDVLATLRRSGAPYALTPSELAVRVRQILDRPAAPR